MLALARCTDRGRRVTSGLCVVEDKVHRAAMAEIERLMGKSWIGGQEKIAPWAPCHTTARLAVENWLLAFRKSQIGRQSMLSIKALDSSIWKSKGEGDELPLFWLRCIWRLIKNYNYIATVATL